MNIGKRFAELELQLLAREVVRSFRLEWPAGPEEPPAGTRPWSSPMNRPERPMEALRFRDL